MIFFDTETTGLILPGIPDPAKQPQIIELAMVRTGPQREESFVRLLNPGVPLSPDIIRITGLRDADLKDAPSFPDILPELIEFVRLDMDNAVVAHNAPFDLGMLLFELRRIGCEHRFPWWWRQIDTVPLSGGKRLVNWAEEVMGARFPGQTHRALDDVKLLMECYKSLKL